MTASERAFSAIAPQLPGDAATAAGSPQLRVAFVIDHLGLGGAEEITAAYLPHLRTLGIRPRVICFNTTGGTRLVDEIGAGGVPVEILGIRRSSDPRALARLVRSLRSQRADLIHAQLELAQFAGPAAARLLRIPSVVTLHTMSTRGMARRQRMRAAISSGAAGRLSSRVIAVSDVAARHYAREGRVPPARIVTIHNGIDIARFRRPASVAEVRSAVRRELGIPDGAPVTVTVAALREPKGIQHHIRAMAAILAAVPDVRHVIVGDGAHRQVLAGLAAGEGVGERIVFAGARSDVPRILHAADLFVLPTLTEALPTVVAEAMAAGVPVVASRVGGIPEMIVDGESGLLLEPGDERALAEACIALLGDPARAASLAAAALRVVRERFDMARQAAALAGLYRGLVAGGAP